MSDIEIKIYNQHPEYIIDEGIIKKILRSLQQREQTEIKKLTIIISTDQHLNRLKQEFYDQDVLTDTISFNLNEPNEPVEGEIYISADRIVDNAKKYEIESEREFANVLIHSVLHTIGYEDEDDQSRKKMFALQEKYLAAIEYQGIFTKKEEPENE